MHYYALCLSVADTALLRKHVFKSMLPVHSIFVYVPDETRRVQKFHIVIKISSQKGFKQ